jgi:hypothetical protein
MQTWSEDNQQSAFHQHINKIILVILACFALAGLILGFAIGGFTTHHTSSPPASAASIAIAKPHTTPSPVVTATTTPENVDLGFPLIGTGDYTPVEQADGATSYTLSALIVNKSTSTPIQATDVTCRLWLTKSTKATQSALSANAYALPKTTASFHQTFPAEVAGALSFTSGNQVQNCAAKVKTTWTYTVSPTIKAGVYFLAVLADWQGKHYNWYMLAINIH